MLNITGETHIWVEPRCLPLVAFEV